MGFLKDVRSLSKQAKGLSATSDSGAGFREMNAKMSALNASMSTSTASLDGPAGDAFAGEVNIIAVEPSAMLIGGRPALTVSVLILAPDRAPVPSAATFVVPPARTHEVVPGATLPAVLSASSPTAFTIDFDAASSRLGRDDE